MRHVRATTEEDKERKKHQILDVAADFFEKSHYNAIKVNDIAEKAGVAKGTVFFYFKTKEELFLELTRQECIYFFSILEEKLIAFAYAGKKVSLYPFIDMIVYLLDSCRNLSRLFACSSTIFEQNADPDSVKQFWLFLHENNVHLGRMIESCSPFIPKTKGYTVMTWIFTLIAGLQPVIPVMESFSAENIAENSMITSGFKKNFRDMFYALLKGLKK